jgi:hypothetical protein
VNNHHAADHENGETSGRKNTTSKYAPNAGRRLQKAQTYTLDIRIQIMDNGLASRRRR